MSALTELVAKWRQEAEFYDISDPHVRDAYDACAEELDAALPAAGVRDQLVAFALDILTERDEHGNEHAMTGQQVAWAEQRGLCVAFTYSPEVCALIDAHTPTPEASRGTAD